MGLILFGLMIAIPLLEIAVFIVVGQYIGLWPTLAAILLTAIVGTAIIRHQGIGIINKARQTLAAGEVPVGAMFEGLSLLLAGLCLVTPGFVTDTLGFLLLIPRLRQVIAAVVVARAAHRADVRVGGAASGAHGTHGAAGGDGRAPHRSPGAGVTIEGEWTDLGDTDPTLDDRDDVVSPDPGGTPPGRAGPPSGRGWGPRSEGRDDGNHGSPSRFQGGGR